MLNAGQQQLDTPRKRLAIEVSVGERLEVANTSSGHLECLLMSFRLRLHYLDSKRFESIGVTS